MFAVEMIDDPANKLSVSMHHHDLKTQLIKLKTTTGTTADFNEKINLKAGLSLL